MKRQGIKLPRGEVRIIGGKWRSRKIEVPNTPGLRPTPDSVRETVFNWLQHDIAGAQCLDLFSGTGVMAFEALSRGAAKVFLVEQAKLACKHLFESAQKLQIDPSAYVIVPQDVVQWLQHYDKNKQNSLNPEFDLVFIDPPYHQDWLNKVLPLLFSCPGLLKPTSLIYIESEKMLASELLPEGAQIIKHKKAGMVHYFLVSKKS